MEQKKFMDIQRMRLGDEVAADNVGGFHAGDMIQISEKIDGSNACVAYDKEAGKLAAFSRKKELRFDMTLNGFYNYVQSLDADEYADTPDYRIFGEWMAPHTVRYRDDVYQHWYVYDIYDASLQIYLAQDKVRAFCERHGLTYIHVLYEGEFVSWEHCMTFCGQSAYTESGEGGEGIVIKNQTNINSANDRMPFVLKIINDRFSEIKHENHVRKADDPQKTEERAHAQEIVDKVVTKNRVEKEILKMIDEGVLPKTISPQDMKLIAKNLPKRVYDDCVKEEPEYVEEAGALFGKLCGNQAMKFAREIVLQG